MATQGEEWMAGIADCDSYDGRSGPTIGSSNTLSSTGERAGSTENPQKNLKNFSIFSAGREASSQVLILLMIIAIVISLRPGVGRRFVPE